MSKALFSSMIQCELCTKNYKLITERQKNKYICSNYQYKKCPRNIIEELELLNFFKIYCDKNKIEFNPTQLLIQQHIEKIIAHNKSCFTIYYKNGNIQCLKENNIKFF